MWFLATGEACQTYELILVHESAQHASRLRTWANFEPRPSSPNIHLLKEFSEAKYNVLVRLDQNTHSRNKKYLGLMVSVHHK